MFLGVITNVVVFLPLINSLLCLALPLYCKVGGFHIKCLANINMAIGAALSFFLFYLFATKQFSYLSFDLGGWVVSFKNISIYWSLFFDPVTVSMLVTIYTISGLVHLYSCSYMEQDAYLFEFLALLSLFTFFMLILVTAENFPQLFIGWEGVGLCSFLLISFWSNRVAATKAALKAIVLNRIGDAGFLVGMAFLYKFTGSLNIPNIMLGGSLVALEEVCSRTVSVCGFEIGVLDVTCFFFFIGSMGKSAQIGLHTWLPDAMEGPTPVSALIHAATMVTAGVFLVIRCSALFEHAPTVLIFITWVGALTALFGASCGLVQNDLKKVIAYSTCSQLGYMFVACGLSAYHVSFFHLVNHAFFKALLFLSAGAVIHAMSNEQDMRNFGGLLYAMPFTFSMMLIGSLSLMGIPYLTGFYSKDFIMEIAYAKKNFHGFSAYCLTIFSAGLTAFYSFRSLYLTFFGAPNSTNKSLQGVHELPLVMAIPLLILAVGSIIIGFFLSPLFFGENSMYGQASAITNLTILYEGILYVPVHIDFENSLLAEVHYGIPLKYKYLPLVVTIFGAISAYVYYDKVTKDVGFAIKNMVKPTSGFYLFLLNKWYFDFMMNKIIVLAVFRIASLVDRYIENGLFEWFGPQGGNLIFTGLLYKIKDKNKASTLLYTWWTVGWSFAIFFVFLLVI